MHIFQFIMAGNFDAVVALDLCGYAFSFRTNATKIMMNKSWGADQGFQVLYSLNYLDICF